jgi:hypothetical protein
MAVFVSTIPPPNPSESAPTTVPTPRKYEGMEKDIVLSCVTQNRTRESQKMFRAAETIWTR